MSDEERQLAVMSHFDEESFAALVRREEGWCLSCRHIVPNVPKWLRGGKCPVCERPGVWGPSAALHDSLFDFDIS